MEYISFDEFFGSITSDFKSLYDKGYIDETSVMEWVFYTLKKFGSTFSELKESVVWVDKGKGQLPDDFQTLYIAALVEPHSYYTEKQDSKPTVQSLQTWVERSERCFEWDACNECCGTEYEKLIVEKTYLQGLDVEFRYCNPTYLKIGKGSTPSSIAKDCRNKVVNDRRDTILLKGRTIYAFFGSGNVYVQYYATPMDDFGRPKIPLTFNGTVKEAVEYEVKKRIIENAMYNRDEKDILTMYQFIQREAMDKMGAAMSEAKHIPASTLRNAVLGRNRQLIEAQKII